MLEDAYMAKGQSEEEAKKSALDGAQKDFDGKDKAAKAKADELQGIKDAANKANAEKAQATAAKDAADKVAASAGERKDIATQAKITAESDKTAADKALNGDNGQDGAIKEQETAQTNYDNAVKALPALQATAKEEAGKVTTKEGEAKTAGVDESVYKGKTSQQITEAANTETNDAKKQALNALATAKKAQEDADKKVSDQNTLIGQKDEALKAANTALETAKKNASDAANKLVKAEKELAAATAAKTAADEAATKAAATLKEKETAATEADGKISAAETAANQAKKDAETAQETLNGAQSAYDAAKAEATKLAQSAASAATAVRDNLANEANAAQSKADGLKLTADDLAAKKAEADKKVETATQAKTEAESAKNDADKALTAAKGEVTKLEDAAKTAGIQETDIKDKTAAQLTELAKNETDEAKKTALENLAAAKKDEETKQALADDATQKLATATQAETTATQAATEAQTKADNAQAAADTAKENLAQADADVKNLSQILADLGSTQTQQNLPLFADINQQAIFSAFSETLANSTLTPEQQKQAVRDIDESIQKSLIATPRNMMRAFKMDTFSTAMNAAYVSRLTADSEMIVSDAGAFVNPMEKATETQFFFTPFGGVMSGNDISGNLFGFAFGLTHIDENYIAQGHFSYGRGKSSQDLDTQSTDVSGNLFQVGGFTRLLYGGLETDINLNFVLGAFDLDNSWLDSALNSSANFNNYQGNLGVSVGKRFGEDLSVKPYVGLQSYYESQDEFRFDALALKSDEYKAAMFDALVGVEGRYIFESGGFVFARVSYENKLYNSHKEIFMRAGNEELKYDNESYDNVIGANLGARVLNIGSWKLDIEGIYKRYNNGLNFFGGNLGVKKSF